MVVARPASHPPARRHDWWRLAVTTANASAATATRAVSQHERFSVFGILHYPAHAGGAALYYLSDHIGGAGGGRL